MSFQDFLLWYEMRKERGSLSLNMLLYGCHVGTYTPPKSKGHQHGNSIQSSINLGETLLQIMYRWKTADWLFTHQSSITSQILDFIYWMVMIFSFDHMTNENHEQPTSCFQPTTCNPASYLQISSTPKSWWPKTPCSASHQPCMDHVVYKGIRGPVSTHWHLVDNRLTQLYWHLVRVD